MITMISRNILAPNENDTETSLQRSVNKQRERWRNHIHDSNEWL